MTSNHYWPKAHVALSVALTDALGTPRVSRVSCLDANRQASVFNINRLLSGRLRQDQWHGIINHVWMLSGPTRSEGVNVAFRPRSLRDVSGEEYVQEIFRVFSKAALEQAMRGLIDYTVPRSRYLSPVKAGSVHASRVLVDYIQILLIIDQWDPMYFRENGLTTHGLREVMYRWDDVKTWGYQNHLVGDLEPQFTFA